MFDQALEGWLAAGLLAIERSATLEAEFHLRSGLEIVAELPATQKRTEKHIRLLTASRAAQRPTQGLQLRRCRGV